MPEFEEARYQRLLQRSLRIGTARRRRQRVAAAGVVMVVAVALVGLSVGGGTAGQKINTDQGKTTTTRVTVPAPPPGITNNSPLQSTGTGARPNEGIPGAVNSNDTGAGPPSSGAEVKGRLLYLSGTSVVVVDDDGSNKRTIAGRGGAVIGAALSPDGQSVAYVVQSDTETDSTGMPYFELFRVDVDGSHERQLSPTPAGPTGSRDPCHSSAGCASEPEGTPAWSPSGRQIAFEATGALYVVNDDGSGLRALTAPSAGQDLEPSWSPDGTRIVFSRLVTNNVSQIDVVGSDGSGLRQISPSGVSAKHPSWSPDGSTIAFVYVGEGPSAELGNADGGALWVMSPDGANAHQLTPDSTGAWIPQWSPDGQSIVIECGVGGLCVFGADGASEQMLPPPSTYPDYSPVWSPDSVHIGYLEQGAVWQMARDGTQRSIITVDDRGSANDLMWSRGSS